jgi:uncharacterized protein YndB with AHSA1/START domain
MDAYIVKKSIWLNTQPDMVWDMLTNPEKTKRYFFHCEVFSDWKPGSPIVWKGRIFVFKKIELHGEIIEAEPTKILKYKLHNGGDTDGSTSIVTDTLRQDKGGTLLTISDDVGQGPGAEKRYERSMKGWDRVLRGLQKVANKEIYR